MPFEDEKEQEGQGAEEEEREAVAERVVVVHDQRGHRGPATHPPIHQSSVCVHTLPLYKPLIIQGRGGAVVRSCILVLALMHPARPFSYHASAPSLFVPLKT